MTIKCTISGVHCRLPLAAKALTRPCTPPVIFTLHLTSDVTSGRQLSRMAGPMKQDCSSSSGAIRVQVWSTKQAAPAVAVDMRANVCCVKYNPGSAHEIAVGSADHSVHLYDLRNVASPVHVFAGAAGLWILAVSNSPAPGSSLGLLTVFVVVPRTATWRMARLTVF